jgi:hypothetical protein
MKNVYEVLRQKELEVSRLQKEVEALKAAAPLLSEDDEADSSYITQNEIADTWKAVVANQFHRTVRTNVV